MGNLNLRGLEAMIAGGAEMVWPFSKKNNETTDLSRREFLEKSGKMALGTAAAASGIGAAADFLNPKEANAEIINMRYNSFSPTFWAKHMTEGIPPGIEIAPPIVQEMWENRAKFEKLMELVRTDSYTTEEIRRNQPAIYLLSPAVSPRRELLTKKEYFLGLPEDDPMVFWEEGAKHYVLHYVAGSYDFLYNTEKKLQERIEIPLLKSIFTSAGRPESDVQGYLKMQEHEKEQYLQGVLANLENPRDRTEVNLSNGTKVFRPQLIAAWASTWLTNHYWCESENNGDYMHNQMRIINDIVEVPLRNNGLFIRGKNKYYNIKI